MLASCCVVKHPCVHGFRWWFELPPLGGVNVEPILLRYLNAGFKADATDGSVVVGEPPVM